MASRKHRAVDWMAVRRNRRCDAQRAASHMRPRVKVFCIPRGDPRATIPRKRKRERACAVRVVRHSFGIRGARSTDSPIHRSTAPKPHNAPPTRAPPLPRPSRAFSLHAARLECRAIKPKASLRGPSLDEARRQAQQARPSEPVDPPSARARRRGRGARRGRRAVAARRRGAHRERVAARHRRRSPAGRRQVRRGDGRVRLGVHAGPRAPRVRRSRRRARPRPLARREDLGL
ncbi:Uncharacterised protein [Burkholderia pseudomallei]|nr:hypothetical protein DP59_4161 [Burkholderia pseudomallei]CAJ9725582.1 Uncharacterised protein [Burkholderia pseudomallei]